MTFDLRDTAPRVCFGLACLVGLIGAFVGLNAGGLWLDELFTQWVVDPRGDVGEVTSRLLTDLHPPLYYGVMALWVRMFGDSEAALRSFSAICGCGAIAIFVCSTGRTFSLNARLFAAAMATGSRFWFYQTENARDYGLCLLIGSGLLALALRLLRQRPSRPARSGSLWGLLGLMILTAFTHFYLMYESLAVLIILGAFIPKARALFGAAFIGVLLISEAYIHLAIAPHTQYSMTSSWIQNTFAWYRGNLSEARRDSVNLPGVVSLALCGLAAVYAGLRAPKDRAGARLFGPVLALCLGAPLIVLGGGIVSSALISPSFTTRNLLVASPFLWGFYAWLYAAGPERCRRGMKFACTLALSVLALIMMTIVAGRPQSHTESFRESAAWIRRFPACRGADIPVLSVERSDWVRPGFDDVIVKTAYGRYLAGFAPLRVIGLDWTSPTQLPGDLRAEIQARIDGAGCPIIGWVSQGFDGKDRDGLSRRWLALFDRPGAIQSLSVKPFETYTYGLSREAVPSGTAVLFMNRDQRQ